MIQNEHQYEVTKARKVDFLISLKDVLNKHQLIGEKQLLEEIEINALISQIDTFNREIHEYEQSKTKS